MGVSAHEIHRQRSYPSRVRKLLPLVLATMTSQALLVVLTPTVVAIVQEFGEPVGVVAQARPILAGAAIATSLGIAPLLDRVGVRPLLSAGALLAVAGSAGAALSHSLPLFICIHAVTGVGFACLLSAGFSGIATFDGEDRTWAAGYIVGASALAWVLVNPLAGALTESLSWRYAYALPALFALCVLTTARDVRGGHSTMPSGVGLLVALADRSARRWILAETISYFAWGTYLTFIGAFFIEVYEIGEAAAGILLALGAAAFFATSVRGVRHPVRLPRPLVVAVTVLIMGGLIALQFSTDDPMWIGLIIFFLCTATGGIRVALAVALGLSQLPSQPGSMMAARAAATQTGYLLGGLVGGATLSLGGYGALGLVLAAGLGFGAALVSQVNDPPADPETGNARR
jgi:predicted MFS family arabinose efflux permease